MAGNSDDDENNSKLAAPAAPATTTTPAVVAAVAAADAADDFVDDDSSDVEMEGKNYCFNVYKKVNCCMMSILCRPSFSHSHTPLSL